LDPETAAYLARRQTEGKTRREAIRCWNAPASSDTRG
jgi:hypothetical protein